MTPVLRYRSTLICLSASVLSGLLVSYSMLRSYLWAFGEVLWDSGGDGLKNYFTFSYQYRYGSGLHFDGMLYPYGDLATYADAQPLLVWFMQGLRYLGLDCTGHSLLVLQLSMIIGLILAHYFVTNIFRFFELPIWASVLLALVVIAMTPQLLRMQSHYALSYAFIIPMYWWALLQSSDNREFLLGVTVIALLPFICGFLHPYWTLILVIFGLSFSLVKTIANRELNYQSWIVVILPLVAFYGVISWLDPVADRPSNPYGLDVYKTEVADLLPFFGYFYQIMGDELSLRSFGTEGYAYPGIIFFLASAKMLYVRIRRKAKEIHPARIYKLLNISLISGLLVLGAAMGLHLLLGDALLDILPPLRQFRSLGRLSWVIYYVSISWAGIYLYRQGFHRQSSAWSRYLFIAAVVLTLCESQSYHSKIHQHIKQYHGSDVLMNETTVKGLLDNIGIQWTDYQAIHALPGSTVGTEKLSMNEDWHVKYNAFALSHQTGLPLTSANMSRSSVQHVLSVVQLASHPYNIKMIADDLTDQSILLLIEPRRISDYEHIISLAELLAQTEYLHIYRLDPSIILAVKSLDLTEIVEAQSIQNLQPNSTSVLHYESFDWNETPGLRSTGARLINGSDTLLDYSPINGMLDSLMLSFWYAIEPDLSGIPSFELSLYDINNELLDRQSFRDWDFKHFEVLDHWIQIKKDLPQLDQAARCVLVAHGTHIKFDHLLLAAVSDSALHEINDQLYLKNHDLIAQ